MNLIFTMFHCCTTFHCCPFKNSGMLMFKNMKHIKSSKIEVDIRSNIDILLMLLLLIIIMIMLLLILLLLLLLLLPLIKGIHFLSYKYFPRRKFFSPDFYMNLTIEICRMIKVSPTGLLE